MSMFSTALVLRTRNIVRLSALQLPSRNVQLFRQYATKITEPKKKTSTLKLLLIGGAIGGTVGTVYSAYNNIGKKKPTTKDLVATVLKEKPDVPVMRKIINPNDNTGLDIILFQFQTCPFCCKVRAFLDYSGLSYSVVEVDAVLRQSIKWSQSKKVPIVLVRSKDGDYVQLNDSSMIISAISSILVDPVKNDIKDVQKFYPVQKFEDVYGTLFDIANKYFLMFQDKKPKISKELFDEERKYRSWTDNHLVHLISPNVYRTYGEARETFEWFSDVGQWNVYFPEWERNLMVHVGTFAMWLISKRLKKKHGLTDDVRVHLYDACDKWMGALEKKQTTFLGGSEPNLADLSVFGVLCSMEGCEAFKDCLDNTKLGKWFYDVKAKVESNRGYRVPVSLYDLQ